jgi:hypothetical protein
MRAGNGQTCQDTIPMTSDATLEGSGVREGRCRLGVKAGSQKLIMIQARGQSVTSDCNVGEDVLDLVAWDRAGVVAHLVDEPCEVLQHATNNQKGREVDDVVARNLGSRTLDREGPGRGEAAFLEVVREVVRGNTQERVEAGDGSSVDARLVVSEPVAEPVGLVARRGAHARQRRTQRDQRDPFPGGRSRGLTRLATTLQGSEPSLQRTERAMMRTRFRPRQTRRPEPVE